MYTTVCMQCGSKLFRAEIKKNRRSCYPNCGGDEMPPGPKQKPRHKIMAGETEIIRHNEPPDGEFVFGTDEVIEIKRQRFTLEAKKWAR